MSLEGPHGNTGVYIAPNEALYLYAKTGNLVLQSSDVFVSGLPSGNVVTIGTGGRLVASGTTASELGFLSGATSSIQGQIDSKFNASGHSASRVVVTSGAGVATTSAITTTELGFLSGLTNNIQQQLNNVQSTLVLNPNIVPVTNASGNVVSSTVTNIELGYLTGLRSGIQSQIDNKQNTITFPSGTNRVVVTDGVGNVSTSSITTTELGRLTGVTSGIQDQLNSKLNSSGHPIDRIVVTSGSGSVITSSVPTANLTALDSLRSIASNASGNLIVNGHVGILKTNPTAALDVAGAIAATSLTTSGPTTVQGTLTASSATVQGALTTSSATVQQGLTASTVTVSSQLVPSAHNVVDIGTSGTRFRDLYVQGTIYAPSIVSTSSAASNVLVTDNSILTTPHYLLHVPGTSGEQPPRITSSRLSFVPATGNLSANNFIGNLSGIAANATRWNNARTIDLTGDVVGSVTIDGTQNVSMSTTIQPNSVALGTDTTGNYVATIVAGSGGITVSGSGSESASVVISSNATNVNTGGAIVSRDASGNFSAGTITASLDGIAANATRWTNARTISLTGPVTGTVSIDGTQNVSIATTLSSTAVTLGTNTTGSYISSISGSNGLSTTFTGSSVVLSSNATSSSVGGAIVSRDASGNFSAGTITASLNGVAANATRWTNARTISLTGPVTGTVSIDGTQNVSIATTLSSSAVALGTNTTGSYVSSISGSNGLSTTFTGSSVVISSNATNMNNGGTIVSRDGNGDFSARSITANLSGHASSAARLWPGATINGINFDGTSPISFTTTASNSLLPGAFINGSSYNGSVERTWNINASSATGSSTIVARDANGDFSARTITANLSGEASVAARVKNVLRPGTGFASGTSNYDGQAEVTWNIGTLGTDNFPTIVGLTAGGYGGSTTSISMNVDNKGRVTTINNQAIPSATTGQIGLVQLENTVTSTSTTQAGTANAVKTAYDRGTQGINDAASANSNANNRLAKTGDALSGNLYATSSGWFAGNGWALSSLNATNVTLGTLSADRLATSGVTAGTYGGSTTSASVTVDNKGRVTGASNVNIQIPWSSISSGIPSASTGASGIVQLNDTVTSTSTTQAGTANAVRVAYDRGTQGINDAASANNNANGRVAKTGDTMTGTLTINNASPTITFQDTDNNSAFLHCNSNLLYVLRGGNNTTTWTQVNGQWPWIWNLANNDSTCGGSLTCVGTTTATRFISTVGSGTAPLTVSSTTVVTNLNADLLDGNDGSFYLNCANLTGTLSADRLATSGVTATSYGSSTASASITVDNKGRITSASNVTIQPSWDNVQGKPAIVFHDWGTYNININGNSGTVGGLSVHSGRNNEANRVVRTGADGYLYTGWINTTSGDNGNTTPSRFYASQDEFIRFYTRNTYKMHLGLTGRYNASRIDYSADAAYWTGAMGYNATALNNMVDWGCGFIDTWGTAGQENRPSDGATHHVGLQTFHYSSGTTGYGWQMVMGGGTARWWLRNHWGSPGGWNEIVLNDGRTYGINISNNAATATRFQGNPTINGVTFVGDNSITVNGTQYNVNDGWLRRLNDANYMQLYGNSRTMVFRTDGTTQYSDNGAYPFVWLYGGDGSGSRRMILDGNLWTSNYGWLHERFGNVFSNGGTYNLSISGNAAYANSTGYVEWNNVGNKPSTFTPPNTINRVRTDGSNGSYGSITISGSTGGWPGIHFSDAGNTLMVGSTIQGFHTTGWQWYFENGVLTVGTIPWARLSGVPSYAAASHNHDASAITSGTLGVERGGTGQASLTSSKVLIGNGTGGILQPNELHWDNTNKRLGIGSTTPSYALHAVASVNGDHAIGCTNTHNSGAGAANMILTNNATGYLSASIYSTISTMTIAGVSMTSSGASIRTGRHLVLTTDSTDPLYFGTNNSVRMTILAAGNVGVGLTNPSYKFHVSGGDIACSNDVIAFASDERLKTNVKAIENPLDKIDKLNGVQFDWIPEVQALGFHPPRMTDEVGLLAQQVQSVVPQAVAYAPFDREGDRSKSGQDYLTVKYDKLVPLLLEGIKELRKEVEDLKKIIRDHGI